MFEFFKKKKIQNPESPVKCVDDPEKLASIATTNIENLLFKAKSSGLVESLELKYNNIISEYNKSLEDGNFDNKGLKSLAFLRAQAEFLLQLELLLEEIKKNTTAFIIKMDIENLIIMFNGKNKVNLSSYYSARTYIEENKKYLSYKETGEISYLMARLLFSIIQNEYINNKQILAIQNQTVLEEQLLKDYTAEVIRKSYLDIEKVNEFLKLSEDYSQKEINEFISLVIIPYVSYANPKYDEVKPIEMKTNNSKTELYDLSNMFISKSIPKKTFKEDEEVQDYGLLRIVNSKKKCPSNCLTLEQIYKIFQLKHLQYEKAENAFIRAVLTFENIYNVYIKEINEKSLKLSLKFKEKDTWTDFEVQTYKDEISVSNNNCMVINMLIRIKSELEHLLSFYQFYNENIKLSINNDGMYINIDRFRVTIFYDDAEFYVSSSNSPFVISKKAISEDINYDIKSLAEETLVKQYGEELFEKIYVKIKELPEWMQEELRDIIDSATIYPSQNVKKLR